MHTITKRAIEALTILFFVLAFSEQIMPPADVHELYEPVLEMEQEAHEARVRMHGPNIFEDFDALLAPGQERRDKGQISWSSLSHMLGPPALVDLSYLGADTDWEEEVDLDALRELLEEGRIFVPPGHIHALPGQHVGTSFIFPANAASLLKARALTRWFAGERAVALEDVQTIIDLAQAFALDPSLASQGARFHTVQYAMGALSTIAWDNPGETWNAEILKLLHEADIPSWEAAPIPVMDSVQLFHRNPYFVGGQFIAPEMQAIQMLTFDDEILRQLGMDGGFPSSYLSDWTTLPAWRKRAKELPDRFYEWPDAYESQPPESLSPLVRLAVALAGRQTDAMPGRPYPYDLLDRQQAAAQAMEAVYAARVWQEEHGRSSTAEEFAAEIATSTSGSWRIEEDHQLLIDRFMKLNAKPNLGHLDYGFRIHDSTATLFYEVPPAPRFDRYEFPLSRQEYIQWLTEVFASYALVESAELEDGGHYIFITLRLPTRTYWVMYPGTNGVFDEPGDVRYDDIVQLAGWED